MKSSKRYLSKEYKKIVSKDSGGAFNYMFYVAFGIFMALIMEYTLGPATPPFDSFETGTVTLKEYLAAFEEPRFVFSFTLNEGFIYAIGGIIIGVLSMSFLHKKSKLYTVLSQPLNRKEIFDNRAIIPLLCAYLIVSLIKLLSLRLHILAYGFSWALLGSFIPHLIICLSVFTFSFAVGVGCALFNGKTYYALEGSAAISFFVTAFGVILEKVIGVFSYGSNPAISIKLQDVIDIINPVKRYTLYDTPNGSIGEVNYFLKPEFIGAVVWLVLSLVALHFLSKYFVSSYKPEICGFKIPNKKMLFVNDFLGVFVAIAIILEIIYELMFWGDRPPYKYSAFIFISLAVLFLVCNPLNTLYSARSLKKAAVSLGATAGSIAIIGVAVLFFSTDMFGFYNKLPNKEDIESISICSPIDNFSESNYITDLFTVDLPSQNNAVYLDTPEDIEFALDFNKTLLENRSQDSPARVFFKYNFKNGEEFVVKTYVGVSDEVIEKAKAIWETDGAQQEIKQNLIPEDIHFTKTGEKAVINEKLSTATIISRHQEYLNITETLSYEENLTLRRAMFKDMQNISTEERYYPTAKLLGYININLDFTENLVCIGERESNFFHSLTPVYDNMENTISVLKRFKLYDHFNKYRKISKAYIADYSLLVTQAIESSGYYVDDDAFNPMFENHTIAVASCTPYLTSWEQISENKAKKLLEESQSTYLADKDNIKALIVMYEGVSQSESESGGSTHHYYIHLLPQEK